MKKSAKSSARLVLIIIGIVIVVGLFFHKDFFKPHAVQKKKAQTTVVAHPVKIAVAQQKDIPIYVDSFGKIYSGTNVDVKSQVSGQIAKSYVKSGSPVKKGDLLYVIDPSTYQAQYDQATAALEQDQSVLKFKQDTLARNKKLYEDGLISKQDYESLGTDVDSLQAKIKLDQAAQKDAKINLDRCYIHAPISGILGDSQLDPGNIVSAGSDQVLVNIQRIENVAVHFTIPEQDLGSVQQVMKTGELDVEYLPEGNEDNVYKGHVTFVDNQVDHSTGTVMLHADLDNADKKLWSGQFGKVHLILKIDKGAVIVPDEAVQLGQKGSYLFTVDDNNKAHLKFVKTAEEYQGYTVVTDGLKVGDKVVTSGQMALSDGSTVQEIKQQQTAK